MSKKITSVVGYSLLLGVVIFLISSCGSMKMKEHKMPPIAAPFFISFDQKGSAIIVDKSGSRLKPTSDKFPRPGDVVLSKTNITVSRVRGSCYYLLDFGGDFYKIEIPAEYCLQ